MIYLICGENIYLSKRKKQELIDAYKTKGFLPKFFDKDNLTYSDLLEETKGQSLFGEKKLFVIDSLLENKLFKESFLKEIEKFKQQEIIIFEQKEISQKEKLLKVVKKIGKVFQFSHPSKSDIKKLIRQDLKNKGFVIDNIALETLVEFLGKDIGRLEKELEKLRAYKFAEKRIETQDVLKLVKPAIELDIFKMVEAIAKRHKKTALRLISRHLQKGDSPLYLFSMINFQFRNLIVFQEGKSTPRFFEESGLSFFQIKKLKEQSHLFDLEKLKKIYHKLFKIDLAIKTGRIDPTEGLELLILET